MADMITPKFHERKNGGELIFNGMNSSSVSLSSVSAGPALVYVVNDINKGTTYDVTGNWLLRVVGGNANISDKNPRLAPWNLGLESDVQRAVVEACTKVQKAPSEANILVSLAEMGKTMRLVPDLLKNWSSLFQKLNRPSAVSRNPAVAAKFNRNLSASNLSALERSAVETWLAFRFGVRPLIMDTLGVLRALSKETPSKPVRLTQRGQAGYPWTSSEVVQSSMGVVVMQLQTESTLDVNVRAMSLWEMELTKLRDMGASLAAIPEAAIDLVTFSFVLNWVVNVNDFFAALGSALDPGLKMVGGCYVVEKTASTLWMPISTTSSNAGYSITKPVTGHILATVTSKRRSVDLVPMKLTVRADPTKFLRDFRLIDAIALLRVTTRGRGVKSLEKLSASRRFGL